MSFTLENSKFKILEEAVQIGLGASGQVFAEMTGLPLNIEAPKLAFVKLKEVALLAGGPESTGIGLYQAITGDIEGHLLLFFSGESGYDLASQLMGEPPGTYYQLDEIVHSALAELSNVTGSFFMNALADKSGLEIVPSTPAVVYDMLGAILSGVLAELSIVGDDALVVETYFAGSGSRIKGYFFLLPTPEGLDKILKGLEA